jgi:phospholipid/cholesterol/gamma-HCH transport system permease protein
MSGVDVAAEPARVGAVAERRPHLARTRRFIDDAGGMTHMGLLATRRAFKRPITFGPELINEMRFVLKVSFLPLVLTAFALSYGPAGVQGSAFLKLFGALDRLGGGYNVVVVREFAPLVTAIILAGAAGAAIAADLGARVVREETSALAVLGVDPIRSLVVPRLIVLVVMAVLYDAFAIWAGMLGALLVMVENNAPIAPFFSTFFSQASTIELAASFAKSAVYGAVIAVVSCYRGINVSGGPEGVSRAVNQAVVISFLAIGAVDYVFTQFVLATNPILSEPR